MTTPADILDALGRHNAADLLRWRDERREDLAQRVDALLDQVIELDAQLDELLAWAVGE